MQRLISLFLFGVSTVSGAYDYCQAPATSMSVNTTGLNLVHVQVVFRHGDRTPTVALPQWPATWDCSPSWLVGHSYNSFPEINPPERLHRLVTMPGREDLKGNCQLGQLTSKGYQMQIALGTEYRQMYAVQYQLFADNYNSSDVWVRSSNVPRTIQSLMGNLQGLFPPTELGQQTEVIDIHTMDNNYENLWANPTLCPRLESLEKELASTPEYKEQLAKLDTLRDKLAIIFNNSEVPPWNNLFDNLWARHCHSLPLPPGTTYENTIVPITDFINWFSRYQWTDPLYSKLSFSPLLKEILGGFSRFVNGEPDSYKYVAYSAHDTTVGPLAAYIGVYDGVWPPYASHLEMELWQNPSNEKMYLQVKYNGVVADTLVPGYGAMIPYDAWMQHMQSLIPSDSDYQKLCNTK